MIMQRGYYYCAENLRTVVRLCVIFVGRDKHLRALHWQGVKSCGMYFI